jgi:hypothetical protein
MKLITVACALFWFAVPIVAVGCDNSSENGDSGSYEEESPESRARDMDEEGAAALAESDRGVDEEGEKTWKQEALDYYDLAKYPANRTFEMPREWAVGFTKRLYAAGAERVWVTRIFAEDFDGTVINMSDDLLVVLPTDSAKRKAIIDLYNTEMEYEEMKIADVGQKYIYIVAD